jgi:hypothetical protein
MIDKKTSQKLHELGSKLFAHLGELGHWFDDYEKWYEKHVKDGQIVTTDEGGQPGGPPPPPPPTGGFGGN